MRTPHAFVLALIEVIKARKIYRLGDTEILALQGVDLQIDEGEFVAVWGPSGSGKSTLCHLMGIIDHPSTGKVVFGGRDVTQLSEDEESELRNSKIGFVFQTFNLIPVLSALENVQLPLQMGGHAPKNARERALELLKKVGLESQANQWPKKLSGGQRQRVAIARAMVANPKVIIADEPTANLDSHNADLIIDLMRELNHTFGTAFIFSTHDERLLSRVDRKVHLKDGAIVEDVRSYPDVNATPS